MSSTISGLSSPPAILPPTANPVAPELERDRFAALVETSRKTEKPSAPEPKKEAAPAAPTNSAPKAEKTEDKAAAAPATEAPADEDTDSDEDKAADGSEMDLGAIAVQLQALMDANGGELPDLNDLVDMLATIDIQLKNGTAIDPALLEKLGTTLDALGGMLALAQGEGAGVPVDPKSLLGQLAGKLDGMADILNGQNGDIAKKLEALASQLASGKLDESALAALGFDKEIKTADQKLASAIGTLAQAPTTPPPQAAALATPSLKTPEQTTTTVAEEPAVAEVKLEPTTTKGLEKPVEKPDQKAAQEQVRQTFGAMAKADAETEVPDVDQNAQPTITVGGLKPELVAGNRVVHTAYASPPSPINMPHMAFEIVRQVQAGVNKFQIRIDPPEMGRVDVTIDIGKDGVVNARLMVEKAETLDLMQRDQRALEKALTQAGLDASKTNLEFSLKDNPFQQGQGSDRETGSGYGRGNGNGGEGDDIAEIAPAGVYRGTASLTGVNLFV